MLQHGVIRSSQLILIKRKVLQREVIFLKMTFVSWPYQNCILPNVGPMPRTTFSAKVNTDAGGVHDQEDYKLFPQRHVKEKRENPPAKSYQNQPSISVAKLENTSELRSAVLKPFMPFQH